VFIVITFLYAKLFVFLRRPDKIRGTFSDSPASSTSGVFVLPRGRGLSALFTRSRHSPSDPTETVPAEVVEKPVRLESLEPIRMPEGALSSLAEEPMNPRCITPTSTPPQIPPWERVELPVFQVDGQRFGGSAATAAAKDGLWGNWRGLGWRNDRKQLSTVSSTTYVGSSRCGSVSTGKETIPSTPPLGAPRPPAILLSSSPPAAFLPRLESIALLHERTPPATIQERSPQDTALTSVTVNNSEMEQEQEASAVSVFPKPLTASYYSAHFASTRGPEHNLEIRQASAFSDIDDSRRSSLATVGKKNQPTFHPSLSDPESDLDAEQTAGAGKDDGDVLVGEDDQWDLMRMLKHSSPNGADDRFAPKEREMVEFVQESMTSYLNRKTALLMLWFPLGVSRCSLTLSRRIG
jgi:hypothetical protein